jgi:hypothetical protein
MKKIVALMPFLFLLTRLPAQAPELTAEAWRADIQFLTEQLTKVHPNAFHRTKVEDFQKATEAMLEQAGRRSRNENAVAIMQLLARMGDGNTQIDRQTLALQKYPMQFKQFADQVRVVATDSTYRRWLGLNVLRIDRYGLPDIQEKLLAFAPADESPTHAQYLTENYMRYPEILAAVDVIEPRFSVLMLENEDGIRIKTPLIPQVEEPGKWFHVQEDTPVHLVPPYDAVHPGLWTTHLTDDRMNFLYAKAYPSDKKIRKAVRKHLKRKFKDNPSPKVLIDLRENDSDLFGFGKKLIRMAARDAGQIYVAIGRKTYAAATLDALQWRQKYGAVLVGEMTGANPNGYRESEAVVLPNSGIRVLIPTKEYRVLENHVGGLAPDHEIPMDWESYRKGIDPVLEWVLGRE